MDAAFDRFRDWMNQIETTARENYDEVRIHLFSDHDMAVTQHDSRMMPEFESLGLKYGTDYAAVWDPTMVRFWFPGGDKVKAQVTAWLNDREEGRIVSDEELKANGCLFPSGRYGELWYLLPEGTIFAPSFMNQRHVTGMHGYDPREPASAACWLTNHTACSSPARINEIYNVIREAADA